MPTYLLIPLPTKPLNAPTQAHNTPITQPTSHHNTLTLGTINVTLLTTALLKY
jgi:hypothetical protein